MAHAGAGLRRLQREPGRGGTRSLACGLTFQAPDRTLTDAEVNEQHARVVRELGRRFGAEVRRASWRSSLVQRLEQLEQSVKRAADVIARVRLGSATRSGARIEERSRRSGPSCAR